MEEEGKKVKIVYNCKHSVEEIFRTEILCDQKLMMGEGERKLQRKGNGVEGEEAKKVAEKRKWGRRRRS